MQAAEVIKIIAGIGEPLVDKLFTLDTLTWTNYKIKIKQHPENPLRGNPPAQKELIDYHEFCGNPLLTNVQTIKNLSNAEFSDLQNSKEAFQLVDVRTTAEYADFNIGGDLIPLEELEQHLSKIARSKKVIVHCQSGARSQRAIQLLQKQYGFSNLFNLQGGLQAM